MNWTFGLCARRSVKLELLEAPDVTDDDLNRLYDFWEMAGRRLGAHQSIRRFLSASAVRWSPQRGVSVLVLRCGRGDLACSLADFFRRRKVDARILAVERYSRIVQMAKNRRTGYGEIVFDTRDWRDPQFLQAAQFDYVVSSGVLRHEGEETASAFLKTVNRLAKRGFLVDDLTRDWRAYQGYRQLGRLYGEKASEDAGRAVLRGFTVEEGAALARAAGLDYARVEDRFWHRLTISAERGLDIVPELQTVPRLAGA